MVHTETQLFSGQKYSKKFKKYCPAQLISFELVGNAAGSNDNCEAEPLQNTSVPTDDTVIKRPAFVGHNVNSKLS